MNPSLFLIIAALGIDPQIETQSAQRLYQSPPVFAALARGQNPPATYDEVPDGGRTVNAQPGTNGPLPPGYISDPFLGNGDGTYFADASNALGTVGPQPYHFGWTTRGDSAYIPQSSTDNNAQGDLSIFEVNAALRYTTGWPGSMPNWIYSWTPEFNLRGWDGPASPPLPGHGLRFASDFELATPGNNPWSIQLGFTPAFVGDFNASVNSESFNWDGRAVLFYRASPELMIAAGAAYWDRVQNYIIPYAGIVWTPNQNWEWRLMFPKTRVSMFIGNWGHEAKWVYAGVEYNVEAYQIGVLSPGGQDEKVQFADYRAMIGLRGEAGGVSTFGEIGWVFAREVEYLHGTPGYDINSNLYVRLGMRF